MGCLVVKAAMGSSSDFRTFEDLECWQACRELRLWIVQEVIPALPKREAYRPGDQLIRAGRSTTSNIVEGYGRYHYAEEIHYGRQARGSAYEVLDHLITGIDEGLLTRGIQDKGRLLVEKAVKLINGYIRYLSIRKTDEN